LEFINPNNEPVDIKIGISAVDIEGAKKNLEAEIGNKSFDQVRSEAQDAWEQQLEKIVIESENDRLQNQLLYSNVPYHAGSQPLPGCGWTLPRHGSEHS
jgi:putative alpha-1,2-mannosidase